jgi:hypothetical protein
MASIPPGPVPLLGEPGIAAQTMKGERFLRVWRVCKWINGQSIPAGFYPRRQRASRHPQRPTKPCGALLLLLAN